MLPKKFRLTISAFNLIPQQSTNINAGLLLSRVKKAKNNYPKFVVVVPKSLDRRSSARHKTQRIIMRAIENKLANVKAANILILAKKILDKKDLTLVEKELEDLFLKIHLL